ncbi:hypothetical protein [Pseudomonas sp. Irchel s3b6]|uniref:hypothetical protein n=1 Tax=Pseudomonas sp. Irchel s3b6 TaxID=2009078 RepID=UPI000BA2F141|nr:hypothetical protein [Pseudomonas sp. Irchel s3b6]
MSRSDVAVEQHHPVASLTPRDVKLREAAGNEFRIIYPAGTPPERLSESSFYATVAHQFQPFDELILIDAGRTLYSRYLVLQAGHGYAEVHKLYESHLPSLMCSIGEKLPSNHKLVYCGPEELWSAVRNSDGVVVVKNAISQEDALQQLLQHASLRG